MKRILALFMAIALCFSLMLSLTACGKDKKEDEKITSKDDEDEEETEDTEEPATGSYVVTVITSDNTPLEGIAVSLYLDEELRNMVGYAVTDESGTASFTMDKGEYHIVLEGAPDGYQVETDYTFDGYTAQIVLQALPMEYSVTVMVNDGETLQNAAVEICKTEDGSVVATGQTDGDGRFYTQLPEGRYFTRLQSIPAGYYAPLQSAFSDGIAGIYLVPLKDAAMGQTNEFTYTDQWLMPRGLMAKFVPQQSGIYLISTDCDQQVSGYVMDTRDKTLTTPEQRPANLEEDIQCMVCAMEAGETYYISLFYWDPYAAGTISYEIDRMPEDYQPLRSCSAAYFDYDEENPEIMIAGNYISAVQGSDGYYYVDLGGGKQGSMIYANFEGVTGAFSQPIVTVDGIKGLIDLDGFDFSMDGDRNPADGVDCTEEIRTYAQQMITEGELAGLVPVDARLAELLQMLMDKYTFAGIENSWLKMCLYYETI